MSLEPAAHRHAAGLVSNWQSSGVKVFSKRILPHHSMVRFSATRRFARERRPAGGAASSTRWKPVSLVFACARIDLLHHFFAKLTINVATECHRRISGYLTR